MKTYLIKITTTEAKRFSAVTVGTREDAVKAAREWEAREWVATAEVAPA